MRFSVVFIQFARRFYAAEPTLSTTSRVWRGSTLISLVLPFLAAFGFNSARVPGQTAIQQKSEIARVESWFTGKSIAQIKSDLARLRPEAVNPSDKAFLMKNLPLVNAENRTRDQRQLDELHARLERTLRLFERRGVVEVILFRHKEPIVYSKPGVVTLISTEVLKTVGDDDAALNGVIAHELAHELVAIDLYQATKSGNNVRLRELELFCDAVAVVVLLDQKLDPAGFAHALRRITSHSEASAKLNNGESSHPAVEVRLQVISDISALFLNSFTSEDRP